MGRYLIRSQTEDMWVFQPDLMKIYRERNNAPYRSTVHRIERYSFKVRDPDSTMTAFRVLHVRD